MAADGAKGTLAEGQPHRQTVKHDFNLIAGFRGIE
jgi:hypothetical protein